MVRSNFFFVNGSFSLSIILLIAGHNKSFKVTNNHKGERQEGGEDVGGCHTVGTTLHAKPGGFDTLSFFPIVQRNMDFIRAFFILR